MRNWPIRILILLVLRSHQISNYECVMYYRFTEVLRERLNVCKEFFIVSFSKWSYRPFRNLPRVCLVRSHNKLLQQWILIPRSFSNSHCRNIYVGSTSQQKFHGHPIISIWNNIYEMCQMQMFSHISPITSKSNTTQPVMLPPQRPTQTQIIRTNASSFAPRHHHRLAVRSFCKRI